MRYSLRIAGLFCALGLILLGAFLGNTPTGNLLAGVGLGWALRDTFAPVEPEDENE